MKGKKIFFFDIDGTYLAYTAEGSFVPESTVRSIADLRKQGHFVFIATGRPKVFIDKLIGDTVDGMIASNGFYIENKGVVIHEEYFDTALIDFITEQLDKIGVSYSFFGNYDCWGSKNISQVRIDAIREGFCDESQRFFREWKSNDIKANNINIFWERDEQWAQCKSALSDQFLFNSHNYFYEGEWSADLGLANWNKANAVELVARYLELTLEDCYAFGDGENDADMIARVKYGVAMGNAVDKVKQAAYYVTSNSWEDGVYKGLKYLGFVK